MMRIREATVVQVFLVLVSHVESERSLIHQEFVQQTERGHSSLGVEVNQGRYSRVGAVQIRRRVAFPKNALNNEHIQNFVNIILDHL